MRSTLFWPAALLLLSPLTPGALASPLSLAPLPLAAFNANANASGDSDEGSSEKKGTLFGRLFSSKTKEPEPASSDKKKAASSASPSANSAPKLSSNPESKPDTKPDSKASPPQKSDSKTSRKSSKSEPAAPPKTEEERFALARKTASEDPKVIELRTKSEASPNNAESARLMRAYFRTLYGKMRTLEPGLKDRIDMTEAAALRLVPGQD